MIVLVKYLICQLKNTFPLIPELLHAERWTQAVRFDTLTTDTEQISLVKRVSEKTQEGRKNPQIHSIK